jgi:ATP-dependent Clp protease ATP-binding subunit ClpA
MTDNFKIVCKPLNCILLVKRYTLEEEKTLYTKIKLKIEQAKEPIDISGYMEFVINTFLIEPDTFFDKIKKDNKEEVLKAVYESIVEVYPPYQLEFICNDLNQGIFVAGIREIFLQSLDDNDISELLEPDTLRRGLTDLKDLQRLHKFLSKNLVGQEEAISAVVDSLKLIVAGLSNSASFFFVGPTGVGKTQLGRLVGKKYSGNFLKINCAEYSGGHEYAKLIGSPPGYVGHTDKSLLAEKAEKSNRWVFLFDEIEKAHPKFYDFLLSLLDDGTVTDNMGNELDFSESIFIFTSNQGMHGIKLGPTLGFGDEEIHYATVKDTIKESVKKHFSPEFLNRLDHFVSFDALTPEDIKKIVKLELRGIPIKKHKGLIDYITEKSYSEEYGARNIKRFIKTDVGVKVADAILEHQVPKKRGSLYTPKIIDGELHIIDTINYEEIENGQDEQYNSQATSGS